MQLTAKTVVTDANGVLTTIKKDVGFGIAFIQKETPIWATNLFRVFYFLIKVATAWLAGTHLIPDADKVEVLLFMNVVLDSVVWLISHMFGIKTDDLDGYKPGSGVTNDLTDPSLNQPEQAQAIK